MKIYSEIAGLQLKHTYYTSGLCPALSLKPTLETVAVMAKYNFVLREINGSYVLVGEDQDDLKAYFDYITKVTGMDSFIFELHVEDSNFFIFSNISTKSMGTYNYSTGSQEQDGLLKPDLETDSGVFGKVNFQFDDLAKKTGSIYKIQFQASESIWNYYVINKSALDIENCYIKTSNASEFNPPVEITAANGERAICFSSSEPVLMAETSKVSYALAQKSQNEKLPNGKIIFKGLPLAGPINTSINNQNGDVQFVSSLYIYI